MKRFKYSIGDHVYNQVGDPETDENIVNKGYLDLQLEGKVTIRKKKTVNLQSSAFASSYTPSSADFYYWELWFEGDAQSEVIDIIINKDVATEGGEMIIYRTGNAKLRFVEGSDVLLNPSPGKTLTLSNQSESHSTARVRAIKGTNDLTVSGDLEDVENSQRTVKAVPNLTQYTIQASDFDKILVVTASNGATIDLILNAGVAPVNGELQVISINDNKIRFVAGDGVDVFLPEGATDTTVSRGWLGGVVFATDRISVNGSFETTGGGGTEITNITQIPNRSYNDLQDLPSIYEQITVSGLVSGENFVINRSTKKPVHYILYSLGSITTPITVSIHPNNICRDIKITAMINNSNIILDHNSIPWIPEGKVRRIKFLGTVNIELFGEGKYITHGDLVEEYAIRQSPNGNLWKVTVDDSGNEVITAL